MNLPNAISLARLVSVPVAVWLILESEVILAFWLFVLAGVSDAVDGFIAKRFGGQTVLGSYLDPLADKALLVGVYVTLGQAGYLPVWLVILVVSRDIMIIGGAVLMFMVVGSYKVEPSLSSKTNTTAQILLAAVVLGLSGYGLQYPLAVDALTYFVALTTIISGAGYMRTWVIHVTRMEDR